MKKTNKIIRVMKNLAAVALIACLLCPLFCFPTVTMAEEAAGDAPKSDRIIVSMGDSYSSGEGNEKFYGQDKEYFEKLNDSDWLGHRSEKSWPGQLKLDGLDGTMKDHKNDGHWFFVASTGATTYDVWNSQEVKLVRTVGGIFHQRETSYRYQKPQINVFKSDKLENKTVDYVTMTLGGNDVGFSDIVTTAALNFGFPGSLIDRFDNTWKLFYNGGEKDGRHIDPIRDSLMNVYNDVYNATDKKANIIVAGYPLLFDTWGSTLKTIDSVDAVLININVHYFNLAIRNAVNECKAKGMSCYFVSVEEAFKGHEAYSLNSYMNGIEFFKHDQDFISTGAISQYSVHPNEKGMKAYADCVNSVISYLDGQKTERRTDPRFKQLENPGERDVVMVLDGSGSMNGTPIEKTKESARAFIESVNDSEANIGIVKYSNAANIVCDFTLDRTLLFESVNELNANGSTNIDDGLETAYSLLNYTGTGADKKIIVLMSDGLANVGRVGNELINYANNLKDSGITIYTLGFFDSLDSNVKPECQYMMEKIASPGCHFEVTDPDDLQFFFGDIAEQINGQKYIYIRIACPVDVKVTLDGETLDSSENSLSTRTSFGTLTFEDIDTQNTDYSSFSDHDSSSESGDRVKILRLKEGQDYNVSISGTGEGTMNYKIGFMDENGEYSDYREFENIEITPTTQIYSPANVADTTVLNVDSDGDGKYELTYEAEKNGVGKKIKLTETTGPRITTLFFISLAAVAAAVVIILIVTIVRERKGKRAPETGEQEPGE